MGYSDVETFIASGNVIFSVAARPSAALEQKIERVLEKAFDLEITTFLRSRAEVGAIVDFEPFPKASVRGWRSLYVILAKTAGTGPRRCAPSKRSRPRTIGSPCTDARCTGCAARSRPTRS